MPMAEISGARRKEPRRGRYATRSMVQLISEVKTMAMISTISRARRMELTPSQVVRTISAISAMKVETMKTSPWEKFTMPMMPKTIV